MYRAILPNGQLECHTYEHGEKGVQLFNERGDLLAFIPYTNLEALLTEHAYEEDDQAVM